MLPGGAVGGREQTEILSMCLGLPSGEVLSRGLSILTNLFS